MYVHELLAELFVLLTRGVQIMAGMESCAAKSVMSGGAGFALGGMFGLFMSSVRLDHSLPVSMP